jgi:hypothetical protein
MEEKTNKTVISYCLFHTIQENSDIRNWDNHSGTNRYWYNIPAIICVNRLIFPNAEIHLFITKNLKSHFLYPFLISLSENISQFKIFEIDQNYLNTEITLYRFLPLFNKTCDVLFCRDLDSVPNEDEILSSKFFVLFEQFFCQNIRSHTNHKYPITTILAGLCGFRPKLINFIEGLNFEEFYKNSNSDEYGIDQKSIIQVFTKETNWVKKHFVDIRINTKLHDPGKPILKCKSYKINEFKKSKFLRIADRNFINHLNSLTSWAGEPVDSRGIWLIKCLIFADEKGKQIIDIIKSDEKWQEFYFQNLNETVST